jgi:hypothetical protein
VSQAAGNAASATFDKGTVVPHSKPAAISAATARLRLRSIRPWSDTTALDLLTRS